MTDSTAVPMPDVTAPVRGLFDRMSEAGLRLTPMRPYRRAVDVGFDNGRAMGDGALFGAVIISATTGKFLRATLWFDGAWQSHRLLAGFRAAVEQALGDVPF